MTDYTKKLGTAIATVAILANAALPVAFAGTTITISNNGADSDNDATVDVNQDTDINQSNDADFNNYIDGDANTGDNDANQNNGGSVNVQTGNASVNATVQNSANQNWANVDCCANNDLEVKIGHNGADSNNTIDVDRDSDVDVDQDNDADFDNYIKYLDAKTGNNDANQNNGGDVNVQTGDASVTVAVSNWANSNSARVGSAGDEANVSLKILDNAADSDNDITLDLD